MTAAWCRWARPQELFERPRHTFVGYFIGSPGMNLLPAEIAGNRGAGAGRRDRARARPMRATGGQGADRRAPRVSCACRATEGLPVAIRRVEDVGRHRIVRAELRGMRDQHHRPRRRRPSPADTDPRASSIPAGSASMPTTGACAPSRGGLTDGKDRRTTRPGSWCCRCCVLVAFSAVIPLMTVVNYSFQDTFGQQRVLLGRAGLVRGDARLRADVGRAGPADACSRRSSWRSRCRSASSSR